LKNSDRKCLGPLESVVISFSVKNHAINVKGLHHHYPITSYALIKLFRPMTAYCKETFRMLVA